MEDFEEHNKTAVLYLSTKSVVNPPSFINNYKTQASWSVNWGDLFQQLQGNLVEIRASMQSLSTAVGYNGSGAQSQGVSYSAPTAPQNVAATLSGNSVTVTWGNPESNGGAGISGFVISDGTNNYTVSASTYTYTQTGLTYGTTYTFSVLAQNIVGSSTAATANSVTPLTTPGVPQSVSASFTDSTDTAILVTWSAPASNGGSAITGYIVRDGTNNYTVSATTFSYTKSSLTYGTTYSVTVLAQNAQGNGTASSAISLTPVTTPGVPQNVAANFTDSSDTAIVVTWSTPASTGGSAITGYIVSDGTNNYSVSATTFSYTKSSLTYGTTYSITVKAVNAQGNSAASSATSLTPVTVPGVPQSVAASFTDSTDVAFTVTWSAPASNGGSAITGYIVSDGTNNYSVSSSTFSYTKSSLTYGTTYNVTVKASNAQGNGTASSAISLTPVQAAPNTPTITSAVISGSNLVVSLTQTGSVTVTNYLYSLNGGSNISYGSASTTLTIAFSPTQNTNTINVTAQNSSGVSSSATGNTTFYYMTPLVYYKFNQGSISGGGAFDSWNNTGNAAVVNSPSIIPSTSGPSGTNGYLQVVAASQQTINLPSTVNGNSLVQSTGLSVSFWFKSTYAANYTPVFQLFSSSSGTNALQFSPQNGIIVAAYNSTLYYNVSSLLNQNDGTWKHIVITYSSAKVISTYINGSLKDSHTLSNYLNPSATYSFNSIGGDRTQGNYVDANVCLVSTYNFVLSAAQVSLLYNYPTFLGY